MPLIQISDLAFQWADNANHRLIIDTLRVENGHKLLLKGSSGVGKSTLLNLICGVLRPNSGSIALDGEELTQLRPTSIDRLRADKIGIIYQQFNLLPYLSVIENVLLPLRFSKKRKANLVKTPNEEAQYLLAGMGMEASLFSKPVFQLSIGQQQRVAAARALIGSPQLVIADEPTSALDPSNRDGFIKLLKERCEASGSALILVSHDPALGSGFDQIRQLEQDTTTREVRLC